MVKSLGWRAQSWFCVTLRHTGNRESHGASWFVWLSMLIDWKSRRAGTGRGHVLEEFRGFRRYRLSGRLWGAMSDWRSVGRLHYVPCCAVCSLFNTLSVYSFFMKLTLSVQVLPLACKALDNLRLLSLNFSHFQNGDNRISLSSGWQESLGILCMKCLAQHRGHKLWWLSLVFPVSIGSHLLACV